MLWDVSYFIETERYKGWVQDKGNPFKAETDNEVLMKLNGPLQEVEIFSANMRPVRS